MSSIPGAEGASRSCPAGLVAEVGLRWWRRDAALTERRILMSKSVRKRSVAPYAAGAAAKAPQPGTVDPRGKKAEPGSKQSRVIAMLQSPAGATIAAMMQATGWQQHSVRGFLAGVVRKRLKLKLGSKKVDGTRVYRVATGDSGKPGARRSKRQSS